MAAAAVVSSDAIIGTGADAIIGTGADAIIGTGANATERTSIAKSELSQQVVLQGPIQSIDRERGIVTVLGRSFQLPAESGFVEKIAAAVAAGQSPQLTVTGAVGKKARLINTTAFVSTAQYVPGLSPVVTTGSVRSVDHAIGLLVTGKISVDHTALLSNGPMHAQVGDVVTVVGTQPQDGHSILASKIITRER